MSTSVEDIAPPRRRWWRIALSSLLLVVFVVCGVAGWAAYSLRYGELPLTLVKGRIEAAARGRMPDNATLTLGSVTASYVPERGIVVRLADLSVAMPDRAVVTIRSVSADADAGALLNRHVRISAVQMDGIGVAIAANGAGAKVQTVEDLRIAARDLGRTIIGADTDLRAVGLASVEAHDIDLSIGGAEGRRLDISSASWIPLGSDRSKAWLEVERDAGPGWDLTLEREPFGDAERLVFLAENVPVGAVAPILADPERRPNFDGTLGAEARIVIDEEGGLRDFRGALLSGAGDFTVGEADAIRIASASFGFVLAADDRRVRIPAAEIRTREGSVVFRGWISRDRPDQPITYVSRLVRGSLPTGSPGDPATLLRAGGMIAKIVPEAGQVNVERLDLVTDNGSGSGVGQMTFGGAAPGLSMALSLSAMPAADLRALWPPFVASKTRKWFDENVSSGTAGPASLQVSLPAEFMGEKGRGRPLPSYALAGSIPFTDAVFSPFRTFSKITDADGQIAFGGGAATITAVSGVVDVPQHGSLDAAGTTMTIGELGRSDPFGSLHLELAGSAAALAALSNTPPLNVASSRGIAAADLSGDAVLSLDAEVPLSGRSELSSITPAFRLALDDFTSTAPIEGRQIEDADIVLEGRPESYTVKGTGRLDGIVATVDLIAGSEAEGSADVRLTLDDAARKTLGLGLEEFVAGPVDAVLKQSGTEAKIVELDLRRARVMLPFAGWEKGAGVAAKATFLMEEAEDGAVTIRDIELSGEGFRASGRVQIGADKRLADIELNDVALRPGDRFAVRLTRKGDAFDLRIDGATFDARGLIETAKSGAGESGGDGPPVRVAVKLGSVTGQYGVTAAKVSGLIELGRGGMQTASLHGSINGQDFDWALDRKDERRSLRLTSSSAGGLVRFLGVYDKIAGGNLVMEYSGDIATERGSGSLVIRDFRILEEPALAPVLQPAQSAAARGAAPVPVNPGDLAFERLVVPFGRQKGVVMIDEAHLRGPVIGATGSGTLNLTARQVAVSGTFIPIFGLNNIAGSIPIIGTILGGGRNEGLLGITYKLFGSLDNPTLTMNPLSAIAPGIFRKLFEYR